MPKGLWRRVGNSALPADARSLAFLQARKEGVAFIADTNGARNPKQLALWWCLCALVEENQNTIDGDTTWLDWRTRQQITQEVVSDSLKISLGHCDTLHHPNGSEYIKPRSIAFESMSQEDFNGLFQGAVRVIADWLGSATDDVQRQFDAMIADKRYEGYRR